MKFHITRSIIIYDDSRKDVMQNRIDTDDLEHERNKLISRFSCKSVHFVFTSFDDTKIKKNEKIAESLDKIVSEVFEVNIQWLYVGNRKRIGVEPRQFAMWWREQNTNESLSDIGKRYGDRDHATVLHAKKTVNNLMETNKVFRQKAEEALKLLEPLKF